MTAKPHTGRGIWITGYNPVKEALGSAGSLPNELLLARNDQRATELAAMASERGVMVHRETFEALSTLVGHAHHQGMALRTPQFLYTPLETFLQGPSEQRQPLLALDSVQDPQNLGALIRSACFLGAAGMILTKDRAAGISSTVIKIASGGVAHLPVIQVVNLAQSLERLKESGLWIVGLDLAGARDLYDTDLTMPLTLVVGNEQKGLRPLVRKHCDLLVQIPADGPIQSLNAATAGAIALAEVQRQQRTARKEASSRTGRYQS